MIKPQKHKGHYGTPPLCDAIAALYLCGSIIFGIYSRVTILFFIA